MPTKSISGFPISIFFFRKHDAIFIYQGGKLVEELVMGFRGRGKKQKVIDIDEEVGEDGLEDADHGLLEQGGGSLESKREDCPLEVMVRDGKSSFGTIRGIDT